MSEKSQSKILFSDYVGHSNPPVPPQAHGHVRKTLERFKSDTVLAAFDDAVKGKLFGELQVIDPASFTVAARLEMHSGMCKKMNFIRLYQNGGRVPVDFDNTEWVAIFQQSIFNTDVSFSRSGKKPLSEE